MSPDRSSSSRALPLTDRAHVKYFERRKKSQTPVTELKEIFCKMPKLSVMPRRVPPPAPEEKKLAFELSFGNNMVSRLRENDNSLSDATQERTLRNVMSENRVRRVSNFENFTNVANNAQPLRGRLKSVENAVSSD